MKYETWYCVDCDVDYIRNEINSKYCNICGKEMKERNVYFMK